MDLTINHECIICFEQIDNKEIIKLNKLNIFPIECDHKYRYHSICINKWIKDSINNNITPSCPLCRNDIITDEIIGNITETSNKLCNIICGVMITTIVVFSIFVFKN